MKYFSDIRKIFNRGMKPQALKPALFLITLITLITLIALPMLILGIVWASDQARKTNHRPAEAEEALVTKQAPRPTASSDETEAGPVNSSSPTPASNQKTGAPTSSSRTQLSSPAGPSTSATSGFTATVTPHYDPHSTIQHYTITFHAENFYSRLDSIKSTSNPTGLMCQDQFNPPTVFVGEGTSMDFGCGRSGFGCNGGYACMDTYSDEPLRGKLTLVISAGGKSYTVTTDYHFPTYQEFISP